VGANPGIARRGSFLYFPENSGSGRKAALARALHKSKDFQVNQSSTL
jgi:hypothetical protein